MPGRCETCNNPIVRGGSCTKCDSSMETQDGKAKHSRAKSPMVSSANSSPTDRPGKHQKVEEMPLSTPVDISGDAGSSTRLPVVPLFPKAVQELPKNSNDDIMEKLTNMMAVMSTKEDLSTIVEPLTKSVVKLEEQLKTLSTSFSTFEHKIKNDIKNMEIKVKTDIDRMMSRIEVVELAL